MIPTKLAASLAIMGVLATLLPVGPTGCAHGRQQVVARAPTKATEVERVEFYVKRLGDRQYVEPVAGAEQGEMDEGETLIWYVAAEELGQIGVAAIPALTRTLSASTDNYERQQVFYALMLAVQHPSAERVVGKTYPKADVAFPPAAAHEKLKAEWLAWWSAHEMAVKAAVALRHE